MARLEIRGGVCCGGKGSTVKNSPGLAMVKGGNLTKKLPSRGGEVGGGPSNSALQNSKGLSNKKGQKYRRFLKQTALEKRGTNPARQSEISQKTKNMVMVVGGQGNGKALRRPARKGRGC